MTAFIAANAVPIKTASDLTREQILACCAKGYILGVRSFVLQGGGRTVTADIICDIISDIHRIYPDCAITLSLGEYIRGEYEQMYFAGAIL